MSGLWRKVMSVSLSDYPFTKLLKIAAEKASMNGTGKFESCSKQDYTTNIQSLHSIQQKSLW